MNKKTFNPYGDMRIDRVKAHHTYLKPRKEKMNNYNEDDEYAENIHSVPWEIGKIKNLCAGKPPPNLKKERIFDTMNDGKPIKKKKESKKDKDTRAFVMMDGKKYHEIGSSFNF